MLKFEELGIQAGIINGLQALNFASPTPVQEEVIPIMLENQSDMICLAQTGTGKTASFGIPLIQLTDTRTAKTQALVLCPTRELCVQVARDIASYARYVPSFKILAVYGGASIEQQIRILRQGAHLIVATPGRLHDLIRRKEVDISAIRSVILDEADEMLQMGFKDELNLILAQTPARKKTYLFSATMPEAVSTIARNYMTAPLEITVGEKNAGTDTVQHIYFAIQAKDRYSALKRIVDHHPEIYSIIFCRTRQETKDVAEKLMQDGYGADALHAELSQGQRDQVMGRFRSRSLQLLVATDVAARGLDVNDLTHVINYNLPDDAASYTHRSGRTGRAGKNGVSIALIQSREIHRIKEIERRLNRKFTQGKIPTGEEICRKKLVSLVDSIRQLEPDHRQIAPVLPELVKALADLDREELISRFIALQFNSVLEYYRKAPDLNIINERGLKSEKNSRAEKPSSSHKFTKFYLNVGKKDGIFPQHLIGEINDLAGLPRIRLGKIEIMKNTVLFEADSRFTPQVLDVFQHLVINGKTVSIKVVDDAGNKTRTEKPAWKKRNEPVQRNKKPYGRRVAAASR
jgi:ATP-dependent RNA helicase DeaD